MVSLVGVLLLFDLDLERLFLVVFFFLVWDFDLLLPDLLVDLVLTDDLDFLEEPEVDLRRFDDLTFFYQND